MKQPYWQGFSLEWNESSWFEITKSLPKCLIFLLPTFLMNLFVIQEANARNVGVTLCLPSTFAVTWRTLHSIINPWIIFAKTLGICLMSNKLKRHVHYSCSLSWFFGFPCLAVKIFAYGIHIIEILSTPDLVFATQRYGIFASYARKHETNNCCFENIQRRHSSAWILNVFSSFGETTRMLTCSD